MRLGIRIARATAAILLSLGGGAFAQEPLKIIRVTNPPLEVFANPRLAPDEIIWSSDAPDLPLSVTEIENGFYGVTVEAAGTKITGWVMPTFVEVDKPNLIDCRKTTVGGPKIGGSRGLC